MIAAAVVSFAVTLAATPLLGSAARRLGLLDQPNQRSSHSVVTPRAGGLAILLGLVAALASGGLWRGVGSGFGALCAGSLLVALVGLLDDRFGLPPWPRLLCHLGAAVVVVRATGGLERLPLPPPLELPLGALGAPLAVLWVVALLNFFNFMDGIDGLAGAQGLITAAALAFALRSGDPAAAALAAALAAACAGFLFHNWAPASVFLGDAGSGLVGYTLASLPLLAPANERSEVVMLAAASLFLFLGDASTCLLRRALRGERWYAPHREHLYQRLVRSGAGHGTVSALLATGMAVTTIVAALGLASRSPLASWGAFLLGGGWLLGEWALVRRRERRGRARV